jgi:hypothetical protein
LLAALRHPLLHRRAGALQEAGEPTPRSEQRLLEGVLGVLNRAKHPVAVGVELPSMPRHQQLEGRLVAPLRVGQ